ncbi:MAG TPA: polyhydroxyalkanoate synthesis regulator DNA-binding domain-containing protein [Gemmataceae bacterium]|nr:polyhydroxyalkanoate synthesis regulator DNA-binding domain-containing protein [Gemmataceae bacterium]
MSTPEGPTPGAPAVIVRYPNRRLYDRSEGRYVTLQDVEEKVRRGLTVMVRDSKTGEDLTRAVLTQILLERHPERMGLFPVSFLHLAIRANEAMLGLLTEYVRQSLAYAELLQHAAPVNPLLGPQAWLRAFLPNLAPRDEAGGGLDAIASRLAELERRLDDLRAGGGEPGPTPDPQKERRKRGNRGRPERKRTTPPHV